MFSFKILRPIAVMTVILGLCFSVFADTIRLKDGSIVKGRVVGFKDGQFVIVIGDGSRQRQMTFYSDEISAIEFDGSGSLPNTNAGTSIPTQTTQKPPVVVTTPVKTETPKTTPTSVPQTVNASISGNNTATKPIKLNTKVLADNTANGWTNTGWVVRKGQKIRITGTGRISLGNGRYTTPSGVASLPDGEKLMKDRPTGGLIAVVGDDNNDFIFIGSVLEFTATRDGALFLGVNEGYLDDNSGSYDVSIEIDPS